MERPELRIFDEGVKTIIGDLIDLAVHFNYESLREYWNSNRLRGISDTSSECHGRGKAMNSAAESLLLRLEHYIPDDQHEEIKAFILQESKRRYKEALKREESSG